MYLICIPLFRFSTDILKSECIFTRSVLFLEWVKSNGPNDSSISRVTEVQVLPTDTILQVIGKQVAHARRMDAITTTTELGATVLPAPESSPTRASPAGGSSDDEPPHKRTDWRLGTTRAKISPRASSSTSMTAGWKQAAQDRRVGSGHKQPIEGAGQFPVEEFDLFSHARRPKATLAAAVAALPPAPAKYRSTSPRDTLRMDPHRGPFPSANPHEMAGGIDIGIDPHEEGQWSTEDTGLLQILGHATYIRNPVTQGEATNGLAPWGEAGALTEPAPTEEAANGDPAPMDTAPGAGTARDHRAYFLEPALEPRDQLAVARQSGASATDRHRATATVPSCPEAC